MIEIMKCHMPVDTFTVNFRWYAKAFALDSHHCPNELGRTWEFWDENRRSFIKAKDGMEVICTDAAGIYITVLKMSTINIYCSWVSRKEGSRRDNIYNLFT